MDNWKSLVDKETSLLPVLQNAIKSGRDWFVSSGIQHLKSDSLYHGAVQAWYDSNTATYGFFYPESTGYAISFLLYLNQQEKNADYFNKAKAAAKWLQKQALDHTLMEIRHKFFLHPQPSVSHISYSFDNSIIASGFVHLYTTTGNSQYLDFATEMADRLVQNMQSEEGYFYSHFDIETGKIMEGGDKWSLQPSSHHAKVALFLMRLYEETKKKKYRESANRICQWVMGRQLEDGRFVTNSVDNSTLHHPHCYALEGMLFAGVSLNDEKMLKSVERGIQWLLRSQLSNGGIPAEFNNNVFSASERGDSLAQTIRLTVIALHRGWIDPSHFSKLTKMVRRLLDFQCLDGPLSQNGGFRFLIDGQGHPQNHMNSWVTMFAVQAMQMYSDFCDQRLDNELEYLL